MGTNTAKMYKSPPSMPMICVSNLQNTLISSQDAKVYPVTESGPKSTTVWLAWGSDADEILQVQLLS